MTTLTPLHRPTNINHTIRHIVPTCAYLDLELIVISKSVIFTLIFGFVLRVIAIYFGLEMPKFIYQDDDADSASSTDKH